jgi:hypothetical protein
MRTRVALIAAAAAGLAAGSAGLGLGAFQSETQATGSFTAAPDFTAPTAIPVIQKAEGRTTGWVRTGGSYRVYAEISDTGNPASGVASGSADASALTSGQSAAALSTAGGPFTVGGVSYGYRSAPLTVSAAAGSTTYAITSTDVAGSTRVESGFPVTVDSTPPAAIDVQTTNAGTTGRPEINDAITFTYGELVEPESVLAGWDGSATDVVVRITDGVLGVDRLSIRNAANTAVIPLTLATAHVSLASLLYVTADVDFGASGTRSRMVMSGTTVTVTLGTASSTVSGAQLSATTMTWTPAAAPTDRAGNPTAAAVATETGAGDVDF